MSYLVELSSTTTTCVASCPNGTYPDASRICRSCSADCSECTGPGVSANCVRCSAARRGDACVSSCDEKEFFLPPSAINTTNVTVPLPFAQSICFACSEKCAGGCAGPSPTECFECADVEYDGECVDACPTGHVAIAGVCRACHPECSGECSGILSSECSACKNFEATDGSCVASCKSTEYAAGQICRPCNSQCAVRQTTLTCSGPSASECTSCLTALQPRTLSCVTSCDTTQVSHLGVCTDCASVCDGCYAPGARECIRCRGSISNGTCVETCPIGTYSNSVRQCVACNSMCASDTRCSGPDPEDCLPTATTNGCKFVRFGSMCVQSCPEGYYSDSDNSCQACHASCKSCSGPSASECVSCRDTTHYAETVTGSRVRCQTCHPLCATGGCSGPSASQCLNGCVYVLDQTSSQGSVCAQTCPAVRSYPETRGEDITCVACHAQCVRGCSGPASSQCVECANNEFEGNCVSECPLGFAADDEGRCLACHSECASSCRRPNDASQCNFCKNRILDGTCISQCPQSLPFYFNRGCVATCPTQALFYDDTRESPAFIDSKCLRSCSELSNPLRVFISSTDPFRCTTEEQARADSEGSIAPEETDAVASVYLAMFVVVGALLLIVIVFAIFVQTRKRKTAVISGADLDASTHSTSGAGSSSNKIYAFEQL